MDMDDKEPCQTTFRKVLPLSGEGIVSVNFVQRSTPFAIRIRPAPHGDDNEKSYEEKRKRGYVEVEIRPKGAVFKYRKPDGEKGILPPRTGEEGGLEMDKMVSYWFTFNRNDRILKTSSPLGVNEKINADLWSSIPSAERSELAARVDVEKKVSFYPHPLTYNWSPFVLDSSKGTLPELANNRFVPSASLPETCKELYANIASPDVALDWPHSIPTLLDAINYSISTKGKILYEKLKEKKHGQGMSEYLRVTLGPERGSSPGVPYVLEIWRAPLKAPSTIMAMRMA